MRSEHNVKINFHICSERRVKMTQSLFGSCQTALQFVRSGYALTTSPIRPALTRTLPCNSRVPPSKTRRAAVFWLGVRGKSSSKLGFSLTSRHRYVRLTSLAPVSLSRLLPAHAFYFLGFKNSGMSNNPPPEGS